MNVETKSGLNRVFLPVLCAAALFALSACGGGGSKMAIDGDGSGSPTAMPGDGDVTATLMPAMGLIASAATPVPEYARTGDTLSAQRPVSTNSFAPLSASLEGGSSNANIAESVYIKSISSDGASGFNVTYVLGDEENRVHLAASDRNPENLNAYFKEIENARYWLTVTEGTFEYHDRSSLTVAESGQFYRLSAIYGLRTGEDALPAGSAVYRGNMYANIFPSDSLNIGQRSHVSGRVHLNVDFDEATLDGRIDRLQRRENDQTTYADLPSAVHVLISDGEVVGAQFTATWREVNQEGSSFSGDILGEFYGPTGEELGAVFNGSNGGELIYGRFGGTRFEISVPQGDLVAASSASHHDPENSVTVPSEAAVTAISGDDAGGFHVTYSIGSDKHEIHLGLTELGGLAGFPNSYYKRVGTRGSVLWDETGNFTASPEFSHFNVNGWAAINYDADDEVLDFYRGYVAFGVPTAASDLPSGAATYKGRMRAESQPSNTTDRPDRSSLRGDLMLTADFDQASVGGIIDRLEQINPGENWEATGVDLPIRNGRIDGNALSADLDVAGVFEGDIEGRFFGPAAAEVGGVLTGTDLENDHVVHGWFGGKKQ